MTANHVTAAIVGLALGGCAPEVLAPMDTGLEPVEVGEAEVWMEVESYDSVTKAVVDGMELCTEEACTTTDALGRGAFRVEADTELLLWADHVDYEPVLVPLTAPRRDGAVELWTFPATSIELLAEQLPVTLEPDRGTLVLKVWRDGLVADLDIDADGPFYLTQAGEYDPGFEGSHRYGFVVYVNIPPGDAELEISGAEGCEHLGWPLEDGLGYRLVVEAARTTLPADLVCDG